MLPKPEKIGSQEKYEWNTERELIRLPRSPCDVSAPREKTARRRGKRFYMEVREHSKVWSRLHNCRPWGTKLSHRCQGDTSGSDVSFLCTGLGWKHWCRKHSRLFILLELWSDPQCQIICYLASVTYFQKSFLALIMAELTHEGGKWQNELQAVTDPIVVLLCA